MAKVNKSDIVDDKSIIKAFENINEAVKETSSSISRLTSEAKELNSSLKMVKSITDLEKAQKSLNSVQKDAIDQQKQAIGLQQQEAKLRESVAKAKLAEQRADSAATAETNKRAKAIAAETSEYAKLSKQLTASRNAAKDLAAQGKENTKEYKALAKEVNELDSKLKKIDANLGQHSRNVGNYEKAWGGVKMVWAAVGAAVISFGKHLLNLNVVFEKAKSSLKAITGASAKDMEFYASAAKSMGEKVGIAGAEMLKSFERVGSIRPELLKTKEALVQTTEAAITLSQASGGVLDLVGATEALGAGMNQFNLTAKDSSRIINVLAAGSQAGSAEVSSLAESFKNVGAVASFANMSIEDTTAALEVLGEKSLYGTEAGTKLRGVLLKLQDAGKGFQSGKFNLKDALSQVSSELAGMATEQEKAAHAAKLFGAENITAGLILVSNTEKYAEFQKAVTGTNTAFEQQETQMDNLAGSWAKLTVSWDNILQSGWFTESLKWIVDFGKELLDSGFGFKQYFQTFEDVANEVSGAWFQKIATLPIEEQAKKLEYGIRLVNEALGRGENIEANNELIKIYSQRLTEVNGKIKENNDIAMIRWQLSGKTTESLILENAENEKRLTQLNLLVGTLGFYDVAKQTEIKQTELTIKAINEEIASRNKATTEITAETEKTKELTKEQKKANDVAEKRKELLKEMESKGKEEQNVINFEFAQTSSKNAEDARKKYEDDIMSRAKFEMDAEKQKNDFIAQAEEEHAKKIYDIKQQAAQDWYETGKEFVGLMFEIQQNNYDKEIKANNDKYTRLLDNEKLTEDQRKQLEAQRDAENLKIENKKRESQRKQFIVNKAIAIAEIGINTARAVAETIGEAGFFGIPLSVIVGALGAAQAAIVLATPMPAFDKGTESAPSGKFLVGELRPEIMIHNGKAELVTEPTVMDNKQGARVISGVETQRILEGKQRDRVWTSIRNSERKDDNREIVSELRAIRKATSNRDAVRIYNSSNVDSYAKIGNDKIRKGLRR